ncbi:MAG: hypothetical protein OXE79_07405 [Acidimicrobiaceae bacterium]|nr:hypothetical protein [Acidimicrobiaceae bacterium]MCY4279592.1 hypothetical protein [Acidimicrobiaceae bacterium]
MIGVGLSMALHRFRLELREPLVTGAAEIRHREGLLVALAADGITGWGEASPLPGWSRLGLPETETALRAAAEDLAVTGEGGLEALLSSLRGSPHARAGLAGAWFDLQARRAERNLAEHLITEHLTAGCRASGSAPPAAPAREVAVNALIAAAAPAEVEQAARDAVLGGFAAVKLKVASAPPAADIERVEAARAGIGPAAELRLDANGGWDETTALGFLRRVQHCDVAYCEEPVAGVEAIAALSQRSPVAPAADESVRTLADAVRALSLGIGVLIVKPQALGGPDLALQVLERAQQAGAAATVTSFLDSAVGLGHGWHVAAVADAMTGPRAHGLSTSGLFTADVADPPAIRSGAMRLPAASGLGIVPGVAA